MSKRSRAVPVAILSLGALSLLSSSASGAMLYDQTSGTAVSTVPSIMASYDSQGVGPCGVSPSNTNCFAIDDFTVPAGPDWYVQNIHVDGQGGSGDVFSWEALRSDGVPTTGMKEASPFGSTESGVVGGSSTVPLSGTNDFDISYSYGGQVLQPGHYWLSVYPTPSFMGTKPTPPMSEWSWQTQAPVHGSPAQWSSTQCGADAAYEPLSSCGKSGPDLRFRIEGEELNGDFDRITVGKSVRTLDGGVNIAVTLGGPPERPGVIVKKVSGKGQISTIAKEGWSLVKGKPAPTGVLPNGEFPVVLKVRPKSGTAAALKRGKTFKLTISASYKRLVGSSSQVSLSPGIQTIKVVLKKKRPRGR